MVKKGNKISIISSKEETNNGDLYIPIGVISDVTKENIRSVIVNYLIENNFEDNECNMEYLNTIVENLYNNQEFDDYNDSDFAFKIQETYMFN